MLNWSAQLRELKHESKNMFRSIEYALELLSRNGAGPLSKEEILEDLKKYNLSLERNFEQLSRFIKK